MGKVFHIGVGDNGNFAVSGVTEIASHSKSLSSLFGTGYDESALRHHDAMTNFPVPENNNTPKL